MTGKGGQQHPERLSLSQLEIAHDVDIAHPKEMAALEVGGKQELLYDSKFEWVGGKVNRV